jgi:hypothetical protein
MDVYGWGGLCMGKRLIVFDAAFM